MKTLNQEYAGRAFQHVTSLPAAWSEATKKRYGALAFHLPVLILQSGLAQALAFVHSRIDSERGRGEEAQKLLLHLAQTLDYRTAEELLAASRSDELGRYAVLTRKALRALDWYKRFAQSVLHVEGPEDASTP